MQTVYGDKCVDLRAVRRWVQQVKQDELTGSSRFGGKKNIFLRTEFKNLLDVGRSVLKMEDVICKNDHAQL